MIEVEGLTPARHLTLRDPSRRSDGWKVGAIARAMGRPLYPEQQYIWDVAGEIDPETGTYYYGRVIVSVQRQFGKTDSSFAKMIQNCLLPRRGDVLHSDRMVWYLAQRGKDADTKFLEYFQKWDDCPLSVLTGRMQKGKGSICMPFVNGSRMQPSAQVADAGHGYQGDLIDIDEAWSLTAEQGKTLLDGFVPTTITRQKLTGHRPQILVTSTEGDITSTFYNQLLDQCRSGDMPKRWAFFDWGIPDDADPLDLDVVARYHPGLGHLFDREQLPDFMDEVRNGGEFDAGGWARAFGNRRDMGTTDRFISESLWARTARRDPLTPGSFRESDALCFGVSVTIDATRTCVSLACRRDGVTVIQLAETMPGTGAAVMRIRELSDRYRAPVAIDKRGPAGDLADKLAADGVTLVDMDANDFMASGQSLMSAFEQDRARHVTDGTLDLAARTATRQWSGDSWKVKRKDGDGSAVMESAILAHWGASHLPAPKPSVVQVF